MSGVEVRVSGSGIGELCCKHPYGFEGYADENGDRIREHNASDWFQTGDMAKIQADGNIRIFGRCDNSINRSGFLVLFSDIESAMEKLENIERAVVIASGGQGDRGQKITAFCVPQKDVADADQIRGLCSDILPKYAIPDDIVVIESLPLLPSGKTDRQSLLKLRIEN
jgi:acyl-CoA synthetase (AMP-forming)/AMP-acid ligase II